VFHEDENIGVKSIRLPPPLVIGGREVKQIAPDVGNLQRYLVNPSVEDVLRADCKNHGFSMIAADVKLPYRGGIIVRYNFHTILQGSIFTMYFRPQAQVTTMKYKLCGVHHVTDNVSGM
jgi:hypothetical protein